MTMPPPDGLQKAKMLLEMLPADKRQEVLDRMAPEKRAQLEAMLAPAPNPNGQGAEDEDGEHTAAPATEYDAVREANSLAERRRLMREFNERVSSRRISDVELANANAAHATMPVDPLDQLRACHPVAIARAMRGERAETWALVMEHLEPTTRAALMAYLDPAARAAVEAARNEIGLLSTGARTMAENAIRSAVVTRALREHHILIGGAPLTEQAQTTRPISMPDTTDTANHSATA